VHDDKGVTTISNDGATIMKVRDVTRSHEASAPPPTRRETRRSANSSPRAPALEVPRSFVLFATGVVARLRRNDSFGFFAKNDAAFSSPPADRTRVPFP